MDNYLRLVIKNNVVAKIWISLLILFSTFSLIIASDGDFKKEKVVYKKINGIELSVNVYYPQNNAGQKKPAIAFFHGGGWAYESPQKFDLACVRYTNMGFVCFAFEYRLSITEDGKVPHPDITLVECVKDARSAMRWLKDNAETYGIAPDKIVACGQSAGGQLALGAALFNEINEANDALAINPEPNAIILYSSNFNTVEAWADMIMDDRRDEIWSVSPYHNLKPGMPPVIAFHGTADRMVPYSVVKRFRDKTKNMGNQFELITFDGRRHYLGDADQSKKAYYNEKILQRTDEFLKKLGFIDSLKSN